MGKWLSRNAVNLLIVLAFAGLLYWLFKDQTPSEIWTQVSSVALVVLGLGFVIFIHELGHFLAAKACDVHVEAFSIGFGPPIPGCQFKYGETDYKIGVLPLGGYVKMLAENPGEASDQEKAKDPRAFINKSVGQRMLIISAGVIMNIILGLVFFIYVFLVGKSEPAPRVSYVEAGSPAYLMGIEGGSEILQIKDNTNPTFAELRYVVALARPNSSQIYMKWRTPWGEVREGHLVPRKLDSDANPVIGVGFPFGHELARGWKAGQSPAELGSPAARAPFRAGDKLIGVRREGEQAFQPITNGWDLALSQHRYRNDKLEFQVQRGNQTEVIAVEPRSFHAFGFTLEMGPIVSKQDRFPTPASKHFQVGDTIIALDGQDFDPMRLPDLVMDKALTGKSVAFTVRRQGQETPVEITISPNEWPPDLENRGTWIEQLPGGDNAPVGIPILGITYDVKPIIRTVDSAGFDEATRRELDKLKPGDEITEVKIAVKGEGRDEEKVTLKLDKQKWPSIFWTLQLLPLSNEADKITASYELRVKKQDGSAETVSLNPQPDPSWYFPRRGFKVELDAKEIKADGVGQAIAMGLRDTKQWIVRIYLSLRSIILGDHSFFKNVTGPIGMVKATYSVAERSFTDLILFLGIISINLAVINFLPIPVLDGGHMMFLIIEKIRGKPASERALIIANMIGLVLLLGLMLTVIVLDFSKMEWVQRMFQA